MYSEVIPGTTATKNTFKEAKYLTVSKAPSMDKELGSRQITLNVANNVDFATFADGFDDAAPRKDYEEATWKESATEVIAYVPEDVCEDLEVLYGKEVTVIFGEENVVAAIFVTNDSFVDNELVEKIDVENDKITIGGTTYKYYANDTEVYVNGVAFGKGEAQITKVINKIGGDATSTRSLTKALKANAILDNKNKVERLDLTISGEYYIKGTDFVANNVDGIEYSIAQYIVENIKTKGDVVAVGSNTIYNYKDLIEDESEPKVVRGAKEISLEEIAEGDVLTVVYTGKLASIRTIYVSSERATGEADVQTSLAVKLDSEKYLANSAAKMTSTGKLKEVNTTVDYTELKKIDGEEVELYLNILGEYVALVSDSSAADGLFGVVTSVSSIFEDKDNDFNEYRSIKIMLPDGDKASRYQLVYEEATDKTKGANNYDLDDAASLENKLITFQANADGQIMIEDITVAEANTEGYVDSVEGKVITLDGAATISYDKKRITSATKEYSFTGAKFLNYASNDDEVEVLSKGWKSLISKNDDNDTVSNVAKLNDVKVVVDENDDVLLVYSKINSNEFVASDNIFAIVTNIDHKDSGKETVTVTTVSGDEETYEAGTENLLTNKKINVADFVMFTVKDGKIDVIEKLFDVIAMNDLNDEKTINVVNTPIYSCDGTYTCGEGLCTDEEHANRTVEVAATICTCGVEADTVNETPTGYKCQEDGCAGEGVSAGNCNVDNGHGAMAAIYAACQGVHVAYVPATYSCEQTENPCPEGTCANNAHVNRRDVSERRVNTVATLSGTSVKAVLTGIIDDNTTKENLTFNYNDKREDRLYYTEQEDCTPGTTKVAAEYINNKNLVIIDLSDMTEDCEGIAFVDSLEEIDGETVIAITINDESDDDEGAEILVVIK